MSRSLSWTAKNNAGESSTLVLLNNLLRRGKMHDYFSLIYSGSTKCNLLSYLFKKDGAIFSSCN